MGAGARTVNRAGRTLLAAAALAAGAVVPGAAAPAPGPAVVAGQASVSTPQPGTTLIQQTTEKAILNWPSLTVPTGGLLRFQQPDSAAIALNRVLGGVTTIDGSLIANGRVWIINPNGVLFGSGASVNVAGLIATTSDIDNQDFLDGNYKFGIASTNPAAAVTNAGRITATGGGAAVLAGPHVANTGVIEARLGEVVLGGANQFTVDFSGDKLLSFAIAAPVTPPPAGTTAGTPAALVSNSGRISADGGTVLLTARAARGVLDNVVNTSGMISATTAHAENGTIVLDAGPGGTASVAGSLDVSGRAPGETGGTVAVLGRTVAVDAGARIDAAGAAGGGTVLIGGNLHGAGPEPNAKNTVVAPGAVIDASAITSGNGGTVAVWAEDDTVFNGTIEVRGGAEGGNGGLAETSGTQLAVTTGTVDALAPQGQTGTWLLDPTDIVIKTGGTSSIAEADNDNFFLVNFEFDIDPATIEQAEANVTLTAGDSITFANSVTMANIGVGLTAEAANAIIVDPGVAITTKGGAITFLANDSPNMVISPTGTGGITIEGALSTAGGGQSGGGVSLAVIGGTGVITLAQGITTAGGAISLAGPTRLAAGVTLDTTNGGLIAAGAAVSLAGTLDGPGGLSIAAGAGAVTLDGAVGLQAPLASLTAAGATITVDGGLAVTGTVDTTGVGLTTIDGAVTAGSIVTGAVTLDGASIDTAQGQSYGTATIGAGGASLTDTGGSAIAFTGTLDGPGGLAIADGGGAITLKGGVGGSSPLASLSATGATIAFDGTLGVAGALDTTGVGLTAIAGAVTAGSIATGAVALDGATIETAQGQSYGAAAIGAGGASLTDTGGSAVAFNGTLDGPGWLAIADSGGAITLKGGVGGSSPLASLSAAGATIAFDGTLGVAGALDTTQVGRTSFTGAVTAASVATGAVTFDGAAVTTAQGQSYGAAVIDAGGASLTDTGGSAIAFNGTLDGPGGLAIADGGGAVTLAGDVGAPSPLASLSATAATIAFDGTLGVAGALDTTGVGLTSFTGAVTAGSVATGAVALDGVGIDTAQGQSYGAATIGAGGAILTDTGGSAVAFTGTLDGPGWLAIADSGGAITLKGGVGGSSPLASLSAAGATIAFDGTLGIAGALDTTGVGRTSFTGAVTAGSVATGAVTLDGAVVTTAQGQSYGAAVIGAGGASLTDTGGSAIAFAGTLDGPGGLVIADSGGVIGLGDVGSQSPLASLSATGGAISFGSTLGVAGALDTTQVGVTSFTGAVTAGSIATGLVMLDGAAVTTAQGQSYGAALIGAGGASLTDTGGSAIAFTGTLDGPGGLAIADAGGAITLKGDVGYGTALASLGATGATIAFDGTLGVAGALDTTGVGRTSFTGAVTAASVATGAVTLDGAAVTTARGQSYGAAVIGAGGVRLTDTGGSAIAFTGTLDGPGGLVIADGGGAITLAGDAGSQSPLASLSATGATIAFDGALGVAGALDTDGVGRTSFTGAVTAGSIATGAVTFDGASIATAQGQSYGAAVIGGGGASLTDTGGSAVAFTGTLDGPGGLTIADAGGAVTLAGAVGGSSPLAGLTAMAAAMAFDDGLAVTGTADTTAVGLTSFNGTVTAGSIATGAVAFDAATITTAAGQSYGAATLNGDSALTNTSLSAGITFTGTLDGGYALTIAAGGTLAFGGDVGGSVPLTNLGVGAQTAIVFNGTLAASGQVSVATPGIETFGGAVTIGGPFDADNATFDGTVTAQSLTAQNVTIAGGAVTTSAGQTYFGATTLGADTVLTDTGTSDIDFTASVSGPYALTVVNPGGVLDLDGAALAGLGATSRVADLAGTIAVAGAIDSSSSSVTDLEGTVTAASVRTGAVNLAGAVTTSAGQSYGAATLADRSWLTDTGASAIRFGSIVSGGSFGLPPSLTIADAGGTVVFGGTVSMTGALDTTAAGLTTFLAPVTAGSVATGAVALDGGSVSTASGQSYGTAVLGTTTDLTDASVSGITFAGPLTGTPALTVADSNASGTAAFDGSVTLAGALDTSGVFATTFGGAVTAPSVKAGFITIDGGSVTTSAGQSYGAAKLGADTVLTDTVAGAITVAGTLDGGRNLTIDDPRGAVVIAGAVGSSATLLNLGATAATVTFGGSVFMVGTLDTTAVGLTTFGGGPMGGGVAAETVSTGAVAMSPGITISTGGGQSYGAATLGGATTLIQAGGTVTFGSTLTGPGSLVVLNAGSTVAFNGAVALSGALDTTGVGSTIFNAGVTAASVATGAVALNGGSVTTTSGQSYGAANDTGVILSGNVVLTSDGGFDFDGADTTFGGDGFTVITNSGTGITIAATPLELASGHVAAVRDAGPAAAPAGGGAATLGADTTLRDGGGAIAFDGTLDGAHSLAIADAGGAVTFSGAVGGTTTLTGLNAAAATIAFGGPVAVTGALDTTAAGLTNFGGTVTAASISTGSFTILGDTTLAATGDVTFAGASLFNNGFALDVLAQGNVTVAGAVQNAGAGSITMVAGWDGVTPAAAAAAAPGAYGVGGGSVVIGGPAAVGNAALGSAGGTTTLAAANLTVAAANGFAQLGYAGTGASGAIGVTLTGGLTLSGGAAANDYAQIGHGGEGIGGSESGAIAIAAAGDVTLAGGSGSRAYAQIGHGGAFSNEDATAGFSDTGTITVAGDVVTLAGGSGSGAYAQIGHGGLGAAQDAAVAAGSINFSGTIAVAAAGTLTLSGAGPQAYAQIGNGGYQSVDGTTIAPGAGITEAGDITVTTGTTSSAGALQLVGDAYAQIGNGGYAANVGTNAPAAINEFGDIDVTVNGDAGTALVAGGGTGAFGYAQIGNGDAAAVGVGNVGGDIAITVATTVDLRPGADANAGIWNATGLGTVSGTTMVNGAVVLPADETVAPPPPPPPLPSPTLIAPWLTAATFSLSGESLSGLTNDLSSDTLGSSLNAIAPSSGDSGTKGPIESMTDSGKGTGNVLTGGSGTSALPGGGGPAGSANGGALPGAAQEADDLSSGIAHTLSGTPGSVAHAPPQAILVGGLLTEAAPPLSARETPRALEPADEVYSSWGNEALWDWR